MKILIVDDDSDSREVLLDCLDGHKLEQAEDLGTGFVKIKKGKFDLVVTDWHLGKDLTAKGLVNFCLEKGINVVIQTNSPEDESLDPFRGMVSVLDKLGIVKSLPKYIESMSRSKRER